VQSSNIDSWAFSGVNATSNADQCDFMRLRGIDQVMGNTISDRYNLNFKLIHILCMTTDDLGNTY
jgi:hypothetical protein